MIPRYTTQSQFFADKNLNGGLNSTAGSLALQNNESSDLQNIDFNKFGSIKKRSGYTVLNSSALAGGADGDGLWWYEYDATGTLTRFAMAVAGGALYKMEDVDGTWDAITGALTITAGYHVDFDNFLNEVYMTNGNDLPFKWTGSGNGSAQTVPTGLTKAKYNKQFSNYLILANVTVSGTSHSSRFYWSGLIDTSTWDSADFIDVSKNDGQEITGIKVLADRLVVFKSRSIYNVFYTGDADIPFILPNGGKSNSPVGCVAPWSIQEVENGLVFLSYDGFYYYDGNNSFKISDRINSTLLNYNITRFPQAVSLVHKDKNRYLCALPSSGTENNIVVVWDYFNNAFSLYTGMAPSAMATFYLNGLTERPYFSDYSGYTYRLDTGVDDYPLNVQTAIDAYYYTNWRHFEDLVNQKGIPEVVLYFQTSNAVMTFAYSYDFEDTDQYSNTFSIATSADVYGVGLYGTAVYGGSGGGFIRRDLDGRGRLIRLKLSNNVLSETFQMDGIGTMAYLQTNV